MICEFEFANRISLIWHRSLKRWEYGARNVGSRPRLVQWNYYRHSRNSRLIGLGLARALGLILCDARLSPHIIITTINLRPQQEVSKSRLRTPVIKNPSPIKKNLLSWLKYLVLDVEHSIILVEIIQNSLENQNKHLTLHASLAYLLAHGYDTIWRSANILRHFLAPSLGLHLFHSFLLEFTLKIWWHVLIRSSNEIQKYLFWTFLTGQSTHSSWRPNKFGIMPSDKDPE